MKSRIAEQRFEKIKFKDTKEDQRIKENWC
jgi:hypothetical protein